MAPPRVAFTVQRYGPDILGGAESHARQIAERLVSDLGWEVHVYTTTARDYASWRPHYAPGSQMTCGVTVRRFNVAMTRHWSLFKAVARLVDLAHRLAPRVRPLASFIEQLWLVLQGPYCPALIAALQRDAEGYSRIFFFTSLYYPTVRGLPPLRDKAVLVPTSHDEPPFYWEICRRVFESASLIFANTEAERDMILAHQRLDRSQVRTVGLGIEMPALPDAEPGRYLLYLGRISRGKGVAELLSYFQAYLDRAGPGLTLLLAGVEEPDVAIPRRDAIRVLGFVSDERKQELLAHALCLVNPSPRESLSMVVLEALAAGAPVLVNGRCDVLRRYADTLPSAFAYVGEREFAAHLARLASDEWREQRLKAVEESRDWVARQYAWPRVLGAYRDALSCAQPAPISMPDSARAALAARKNPRRKRAGS